MGLENSRIAFYMSIVGVVFYFVYPAWVLVVSYNIVTESFKLNYPGSDIVLVIGLMLFLLMIAWASSAIRHACRSVETFKTYQFLLLVDGMAVGGGIIGLRLRSWVAELAEYVLTLDGGPLVLIGYVAPIAISGRGIYRSKF